MFKKNANGRRIAATLLAIALSACGSVQGSSPARAGVTSNEPQSVGEAGLLGGEYPPAPASIAVDGGGSSTKVAPALVP